MFGRCVAIPILGEINRLSGIVIDGDGVVVVLCRCARRKIVAQSDNFFWRHQLDDRLLLNSRE